MLHACARWFAAPWSTAMQRRSLSLALTLTALPLLLPSMPAQAMTVLQVDTGTLTDHAALILYGSVQSTRVVDRRGEGRSIWTEITLEVREVWKGDLGAAPGFHSEPGGSATHPVQKTFSWLQLGGTGKDGITVAVPGASTFAATEEVVVFLERTSQGYVVSGGPQGKYTVKTVRGLAGSASSQTVTRDLGGAHLLAPQGNTQQLHAVVPTQAAVQTLAALRTEVVARVHAQAMTPVKPLGSLKIQGTHP